MTALAADTARVRAGQLRDDAPNYVPVKASAVIYAGSGVVLDAGYAKPAVTATGLVTCGVARRAATGSGSDGGVGVEVDFGDFFFANASGGDAVTVAEVGTDCYWVDDNTVTKTSTGASKAGRVIRIDSAFGVLVRIGAGV